MLKKFHVGKAVEIIFESVCAMILSATLYFFMLPPINVSSIEFWIFLTMVLIIFAACLRVFRLEALQNIGDSKKAKRNGKPSFLAGGVFAKIYLCLLALPVAILVLGGIFSSTVFNATDYAGVIKVQEHDFKTDMPETDQVTNIALMDTESAKILGNRKLGALANVVSQYEIGLNYTQINYQNKPMKIANLEYAGFFKWLNNREQGIPGYIMVDAIANTSEYCELKEGMIYADSAYLMEDLTRALRFRYPTKIFQNISFEADENGNVFFIVSCSAPKVGLFGAMDINEVIVFNPVNGESTLYPLAEVPVWVDIVFDGYFACEKYDWYGTLSGGFMNSVIGNKGCKQTTADFGYIMLEDDVWYFTGVTSVTADESNIGFILSNARTGEYKYYAVNGAEEYSAMGAAEGEVQEKGYEASFPSLVNIAGEPTYIMVLKDANGLVKLYALVNVQQHNVVATGESQSAAIEAYRKQLGKLGVDTGVQDEVKKAHFDLASIQFLELSGVTYAYIRDREGNVYRAEFNEENEGLILLEAGTWIDVQYTTHENNGIRYIVEWKIADAKG